MFLQVCPITPSCLDWGCLSRLFSSFAASCWQKEKQHDCYAHLIGCSRYRSYLGVLGYSRPETAPTELIN